MCPGPAWVVVYHKEGNAPSLPGELIHPADSVAVVAALTADFPWGSPVSVLREMRA